MFGLFKSKKAKLKAKLKAVIDPQKEVTIEEELGGNMNEITYAYIAALGMEITKDKIRTSDVKNLIDYLFPETSYQTMKDIAYSSMINNSNFPHLVDTLIPVVKKELATGKAEYYLKYTRKVDREIRAMFEGIVYPDGDVNEYSYLDV